MKALAVLLLLIAAGAAAVSAPWVLLIAAVVLARSWALGRRRRVFRGSQVEEIVAWLE